MRMLVAAIARTISAMVIAFGVWSSGCAIAQAHPLERGLVVSDPMVLDILDRESHGFRQFIKPLVKAGALCKPIAGAVDHSTNPFEHQPLCDLSLRIQAAMKAAQERTPDRVARHFEADALFPIAFFDDDDASLTLTGIINRIDRAYRTIGGEPPGVVCGETRLIYRFGYNERYVVPDGKGGTKKEPVASRLPLTLNLVLNAKPVLRAGVAPDAVPTCSALAERWLRFGDLRLGAGRPSAFDSFVSTAADARIVANALRDAKSGPIAGLRAETDIDRIEVNMQTMRLTASAKQDFGTHAEYLLMVFKRNGDTFEISTLENQIDPDLGVKDKGGAGRQQFADNVRELVAILTDDKRLLELDRGEFLLDDKFLARAAVSVAPGGASRSQNRPFDRLLGSAEDCQPTAANRQRVICPQDIIPALERNKAALKTIKSFSGLVTRLNDMSCGGCHQTRGVAGFHFTGADLPGVFSANAVFVPGSPHFFGDLPRRRQILEALARGDDLASIDFSRGFSARPEERFRPRLANTRLLDGWGAACDLDAGKPDGDPSFTDWTCGVGLSCETVMGSAREPRRGICVTASPPGASRSIRKIGDPLERGTVSTLPTGASITIARKDSPPLVLHDAGGTDVYRRVYPDGTPAYQLLDTGLNAKLSMTYDLDQRPGAAPFTAAQQLYRYLNASGGFPGGNLRTKCCAGPVLDDAACGRVAVDGFNDCLGTSRPAANGVSPHTINHCFARYTNYAALRACDAAMPCRDDYICLRPMVDPANADAGYAALAKIDREYSCEKPDVAWKPRTTMGTCLPPYFVMQFRADKHLAMPDAQSGK